MARQHERNQAQDEALIEEARAGNRQAVELLLAKSLPLVYNIAGRALDGHQDVDDVVQDCLLRIVRGLPALHSPHAYRSWMVAIVVRQVRDWMRAQQQIRTRQVDIDHAETLTDPASDFTALTILQLGLDDQRRELAEATRWLDPDDRDLLALWWLEETGDLTRADLAAALEVSSRHAAVRVQRMKAQITTARQVVRALSASCCPELADLTAPWDATPSPLWRKRLARHIRDCDRCAVAEGPLVPAEHLLAGLPLLAPPPGLHRAVVHASTHGTPHTVTGPRPGRSRGDRRTRRRAARHRGATVSVGAAAAAAALLAVVLVADHRAAPATPVAAATTPGPAPSSPAPPSAAAPTPSSGAHPRSALPATTPTPTPSTAPSITPDGKKGVAVWTFSGADQALTQAHPAWYYTWSAQNPGLSGRGGPGFVPMIWGADSVTPQALAQAGQAGPYLLGFNEPDMASQANMTPDQALALWPKLMDTAAILGSPAVAYGGDTPGGWLDRFMTGVQQHGYRVDFIALHWYGGDFTTPDAVAQLRAYLEAVHARYHKPIWLTEFALTDFSQGTPRYPTDVQQAAFLSAAVSMLDTLPYVQRFAWFGLGTDQSGPGTTLFRAGALTPEGQAFLSTP